MIEGRGWAVVLTEGRLGASAAACLDPKNKEDCGGTCLCAPPSPGRMDVDKADCNLERG